MRNLAIDIGWTIKGIRKLKDNDIPATDSFKIIKQLHSYFDNIYFISRANSEQKAHVEHWLKKYDVFNQTGILKENLYFCFEKRDKALFARGLGITHFIDDRPEVMIHLDKGIVKILFDPLAEDMEQFKGQMVNTTVTDDWNQMFRLLMIGEMTKI